MGNVGSRIEDAPALHLRDQNRCMFKALLPGFRDPQLIRVLVSITSLVVTNSRRRILLNITPNGFPASKVLAKRDIGDDSPIEYIHVTYLFLLAYS